MKNASKLCFVFNSSIFQQHERPITPERPKAHKSTQTEPLVHCITQYIIEHPATVMLLLGLDPMANLTPVMAPTVDYYDTRGRRPSVLEQIVESENGSQTPSSAGSAERFEPTRSLSGSAKELDKQPEAQSLLDKDMKTILRRSRHSASDLCEASESLLPKPTHASTRSLKFNFNS